MSIHEFFASIPYIGETLALSTAAMWAFAVIMFKKSGETVHPLGLNLVKNLVGIFFLTATMLLLGDSLLIPTSMRNYGLLLLSGLLGIALGDTLFFSSLNRLGAGLSAIVDSIYSPFIITLSILFLDEQMTQIQFIGTALIVIAVLTSTSLKGTGQIRGLDLLWGVLLGIAATLCMAGGILIVKPILAETPLMWVTVIRLISGTLALSLFIPFHPERRTIFRSLTLVQSWGYMFVGSFLGTYVAMLCWLGGFKFTQASTASALNQVSTIFIFIFAAIFLKERISLVKTIGILMAFAGALMVSLG